jgi:hypothetical protein
MYKPRTNDQEGYFNDVDEDVFTYEEKFWIIFVLNQLLIKKLLNKKTIKLKSWIFSLQNLNNDVFIFEFFFISFARVQCR